MRNVKALFGISALAAIAVTAFHLNTTSVSAAPSCGTKAECACQIALDSGSRGALQAFLRLYPRAGTACNATASTAGDDSLSKLGTNNNGQSSSVPLPVSTNEGGGNGGHHGGGDGGGEGGHHGGGDGDHHGDDGHHGNNEGHDHDGHDHGERGHGGDNHDGHDRGERGRGGDDWKKIVVE